MVTYDILLKTRRNKLSVNISSVIVLIRIGFTLLAEWETVKEEDLTSLYFISNSSKISLGQPDSLLRCRLIFIDILFITHCHILPTLSKIHQININGAIVALGVRREIFIVVFMLLLARR